MKLNYGEMLDLANSKKELTAKKELINGNEFTIFSYMVQMTDTFDCELAKEFRGVVYCHNTNQFISRPFPKFFNVSERPETQSDKINWNKAKFYYKHDGSLAIPVIVNGEIKWKTKKSFYSNVAIKIQSYWEKYHKHSPSSRINETKLLNLSKYHTLLFEYVAPDNQIVLPYEVEELIYLGFRDNETGEIILNEHYEATMNLDDIPNLTGIEGFVIHDGNQLIKKKTNWYLQRHKICTDFNPKEIIKATLNDEIDDIIGTVYQLGMDEYAKKIEKLRDETLTVNLDINSRVMEYWFYLDNIKCDDRKEFAMLVNSKVPSEYKGIMFSLKDDKNIKEAIHKLTFNEVYSKYKE